jgi:anthranilate/para-aminobenzoate synthase component II
MFKKKHKKEKIFVVGGYNAYANWAEREFTDNFEEAQLIWFIGGSDWSPKYYNQPDGGYLHCDEECDKYEMFYMQRAIAQGKKIFGTCRGAQILPCVGGLKGSIFQHIYHPFYHTCSTYDSKELVFNSLHHNLVCLNNLKEGTDYKLLAWSKPSSFHLNGYDKDIQQTKDAEVVFYPKLGNKGAMALGIQAHPEIIYSGGRFSKYANETIEWCQNTLNKFLNNKL